MTALDGVEEDFCSFLDALEERVVLITSRGSFLVGMMTEDLLAVGALDLFLSGSVSVLGQTENGVVILLLSNRYQYVVDIKKTTAQTNLPVLCIPSKHHWVLCLADFSIVNIFDFLHILSSLDALIFRESALVSLSPGVGEEMLTDRLDFAVNRCRELTEGFEILLASPTGWEEWERQRDLYGRHDCGDVDCCRVGQNLF